MNTEQLSMLEVAIELMSQKKTPQPIMLLINEVLEIKEHVKKEETTNMYRMV